MRRLGTRAGLEELASWDEEQRAATLASVRARLAAGQSYRTIAYRLAISTAVIRRLEWDANPRPLDTDEDVLRAIDEGAMPSVVAGVLGIDTTNLKERVERIRQRLAGTALTKSRAEQQAINAAICERWQRGESPKEIAAALNVRRPRILQALERAGLRPRDEPRPPKTKPQTVDATKLPAVTDWQGERHLVEEVRPTSLGWPIMLGRPWGDHPTPGGQRGRRVILTPELATYLRAHSEPGYALPPDDPAFDPLPISPRAITRLRTALGRSTLAGRQAWWLARIDDLRLLTAQEFRAKHRRPGERLSISAVQRQRELLVGFRNPRKPDPPTR